MTGLCALTRQVHDDGHEYPGQQHEHDHACGQCPDDPGSIKQSTPHQIDKDAVKVIPWRDADNIAPAGSINSDVEEMAQYLRFHLGNGTYKGQRLVSATNLGVTRSPP